ncbi:MULTISPECIES: nicotianamine synthase family protein [Paenibacillus]|uniref:nicotianamine synthase family protein n=1 Tax=Paenibacillus TaxID=44249 RepID=UPI0022B8D66B|nr:nicotianamine synthase family protein [Paenibacillus caseinilyticus]MCZ8520487.1 nicotianamine synthase family protein [Paenibacillus caseinilyticus]
MEHDTLEAGSVERQRRYAGTPRIPDLIELVKHTWSRLIAASARSLPDPCIQGAVEELRRRVREVYSPEEVYGVMNDPEILRLLPELLSRLSDAEGESERCEARSLVGRPALNLLELRELAVWPIYDTLVGRELEKWRSLAGQEHKRRPIAFVGSGPLPMSPVLLHLKEGLPVTCVDIDPAACEVSGELIGRLGLGAGVQVVNHPGAAFDYAPYGTVFVASLVTGKSSVLEQIRRTQPQALVAVRTAEGMRRLMYESVDEEAWEAAGWRLLDRTPPVERIVINSTLFYRRA